jgi:hypothetical protein
MAAMRASRCASSSLFAAGRGAASQRQARETAVRAAIDMRISGGQAVQLSITGPMDDDANSLST